ncbi:MAG: SRPBCC domain-containing protein [Caulobacteraceae bacterium]|nr:SRPBCC domain-containing protein [Caulobacteraceae bacterium]
MTLDVAALWRPPGAGPWLELRRSYRQPPSKIWEALTIPGRLSAWMGVEWLGADAPLTEGSRYDYRFMNTDLESRGRVLRLEPLLRLEHTWFENIPPAAVIAWMLEPEGEGCRLTLTHSAGPVDDAPRTAAGWTMILLALARDLGEPLPAPRGKEDWRVARDRYAKTFPASALRDGRRTEVDGHPALKFERLLARPPEAVWNALVTPETMSRWLQARVEIEPRVGGKLKIQFAPADHAMVSEVLAFDPPRRLEYTWPESHAGGDSVVRFDLEPHEGGSRLVLTHVFRKDVDLADFASGWHWHLDALDRALEGQSVTFDRARWQSLKGAYTATL